MRIAPADFGDVRLAAFLQDHLDDLAPTAPVESQHALDLEALQQDSVRVFVPARALYAKAGFTVCDPFGSYVLDPNSTFMTLDLTP